TKAILNNNPICAYLVVKDALCFPGRRGFICVFPFPFSCYRFFFSAYACRPTPRVRGSFGCSSSFTFSFTRQATDTTAISIAMKKASGDFAVRRKCRPSFMVYHSHSTQLRFSWALCL